MGDLNIKEALVHLGGSVSLYRTLVKGFKDKYSSIDQDIKIELQALEIGNARRLAHSMKGLSGNLGASDLQRYSRLLEDVIKAYIDTEVLEDDMDAILGKEWILFSEELKCLDKSIDLVLEASDEQLLQVDVASELVTKNIETKVKLEEIDNFTKSLLVNDSKSFVQMLINSLSSYNYESITKAFESQDEEALNKYCYGRWAQIKSFIQEFEYDKAKEEILKGVVNED